MYHIAEKNTFEKIFYNIVVGRGKVSECLNNPNHYLSTKLSQAIQFELSALYSLKYTLQTSRNPLNLTAISTKPHTKISTS